MRVKVGDLVRYDGFNQVEWGIVTGINTCGAFVKYDGDSHSKMTSLCDLTRIDIGSGEELPPLNDLGRFGDLLE